MENARYLGRIKEIIKRGGPDSSEYSYLNNATLKMRGMSLVDEDKLHDAIKPILGINSMIGHTFLKPYGYAGDFELIDRIYNGWRSSDKIQAKWDDLYHAADSAMAVRNRKKYFIDLVDRFSAVDGVNISNPSVLNLGSGPCRELYEYFRLHPKTRIKFDCVDMDSNAIEYASGVCDNFIDSVNFINQNVFRLKCDKQYDLIWSAGLFDYFSDKLFVRLTKKIYSMLHINGEMVIGNFSTSNPSRGLMEVLCQWYLYHRSEEKLIELALKAGVSAKNIEVRSEETGINLFLHLTK